MAGFALLPTLAGNGSKAVVINAGGTAQTVTTGTLTLAGNFATAGAFAMTLTATAATSVTLPTTGTLSTLAGAEELTNKTLTSSVGKGSWAASGTWTLPAFTLGGTVSGGGNQLNNVIIGSSTPLAGAFTTLTATGEVMFGSLVDQGAFGVQAYNATSGGLFYNNDAVNPTITVWSQPTAGDNIFLRFGTEAGNTARGSIDFNRGGTAVRYNTTSDARHKIDRGVCTDTHVLRELVIHEFDWKETGHRSIGVFAQEAYEVFPDAISVGDDKRAWGADYSKYAPHLIVGWQNHEHRLAALEAKLPPLAIVREERAGDSGH